MSRCKCMNLIHRSDTAALFYEDYFLIILIMGFSKFSTKSSLPVKCTNSCKMIE